MAQKTNVLIELAVVKYYKIGHCDSAQMQGYHRAGIIPAENVMDETDVDRFVECCLDCGEVFSATFWLPGSNPVMFLMGERKT